MQLFISCFTFIVVTVGGALSFTMNQGSIFPSVKMPSNLLMDGGETVKTLKTEQEELKEEVVSMNASLAELKELLKTTQAQVSNTKLSLTKSETNTEDIKEQGEAITSLKEKTGNMQSTLDTIKGIVSSLPPPDLALNKVATSSSKCPNSDPSYVVDGSDSTHWGSCFAPNYNDRIPWWQVDLGTPEIIVEVRVTARGDCCPERLHDFSVEVFNEDPTNNPNAASQLCFMYDKHPPHHGETLIIKCNIPVTGRFVRLTAKKKKNRNDVMTFCKLSIYGPSVL